MGEESQQSVLTDSCEGCEERSAALAALSLSPSPQSSPSSPIAIKSEATSTTEPPPELKQPADTSPVDATTSVISSENTTSETTALDDPPTHSPDESAQLPPVSDRNCNSKTPEIAFATAQEESLQNDASSTHSVLAESAVTAREHPELREEDLDEGVEADAYQAIEHEVEQDDHDEYQDVEHDIRQLEERRSDINRDSGLASDMDDKSEPPSPIDLDGRRPVSAPIVLNLERIQIIEELADESDCSEYDGDSDCGDEMQEGGTLAPLSTQYHSIRPSGSIAFDTRSIAAKSIGDRSLFAPSIISPEDEVLSMRVRSLYDSGVGGMGSDSSSQFSGDQNQRRISSIMEENAHAGVSRQRGARSSFPGANREAHHNRQIGGSVEDLRLMTTQNTIVADSKRSSLAGGGVEDWDDLEGQDVDR
ncbi:hypothetical protein BZA77DRAFT_2805 [Pyronema omphalodes]|nr:hypothetical protein BZA77DRAFT_2805 [Pyronema omphalodes]